jgi:hypothetical protein
VWLVLDAFFATASVFRLARSVYGKEDQVRLMSHILWWKPLGQPLQFVWVITARGLILLMCSDLALDAETILVMGM